MTRKRTFVGLSTLLVSLVAAPAFGKNEKKKDTGPEHKSGMMEEGEKDPAETEGMDDDAAFVPGKKKKKPATAQTEATDEGGSADAHAAASGDAETEKKTEAPPETAKPTKPTKAPRKSSGLFGELLMGFGSAPVPGPSDQVSKDTTTGSATTFGLLVGGYYDLSPAFRLMLRVPWTTGTIKSNNGDAATNALGNPELAARYRLSEPGDAEWAVRLGVGIPVAQGSPDFGNLSDAAWGPGRLQTIQDAASGWHDPELYAMKRLPISPALLFTQHVSKLRLTAEAKAVIMPKIGGSITQPNAQPGTSGAGTLTWNSTAFTAVLGGTASYEVISHVHLALAAWLAWLAAPQVAFDSNQTAPSPFQFVLEPRLFAQFGHVVPSAGFLLPLGGQLGGNINGLRIHVDVVF
jgi:hypothetical protein